MRETPPRPLETEGLVVRTVQRHGAALLKAARRHSLCADDAQDAYQRALEIFMRRADGLDPETAHSWLFTTVRNEARAVREQRGRLVGAAEATLDHLEARDVPSPEDVVLDLDELTRSAEALAMLKPQEVTALWLRASGRAYKEIAAEMQWTYTKVNRCIAEGRKAFLEHYEAIDSGAACDRWAPALSAVFDGEAGAREQLQLRRHLRNCPGCRATALALHRTKGPLVAVLPALLVAEPAASGASGLLVRTYEAVAHVATERAAASTLKVQALIDTASVTKVTAVAASAAALAGGGAATVKDVVAGPDRPATKRPAAQRTAGAARPAPGSAGAIVRVPPPSGTRAASRQPAVTIVQAGRRERRLRAAARARRRAAGSRPANEFAGLPAAGPSARQATAAAPQDPAPAPSGSFERDAAPRPAPSPAGSSAVAREFAP